jgi:carbonic anhydrase/acetyltransferase-like protein (isoleucine patch superfamily)
VIRTFKGLIPTVDPSAYVDQSAQVIGDVEIGAESSVWMNVVIRGDVNRIRIDEVTIGHSAIVHGTTIEDRVLIGMGAVLLNGVHVESDCVIAAGTLLTEGTRIAARSLVMGRPGTVKRALTDAEVAGIRWYSDNYVNHRLDYQPPEAGSREPEQPS